MGPSSGTGRFSLLSDKKLISWWALSASRNSGSFSSWLVPTVNTSFCPASSSTSAA